MQISWECQTKRGKDRTESGEVSEVAGVSGADLALGFTLTSTLNLRVSLS